MKIRNRHLIRAAGWLGTAAADGLVRSLRLELAVPAHVNPRTCPPGPRYVYTIWHENLLLPATVFGQPDMAVLISKHADGQILGSLIRARGMAMVCGSTNRGGVEAVRQILDDRHGKRHLAVTPDGPRGPRRVVQPGIVYVASRAGMAIVPIGVGYHNPWRAGSWDSFAIPKPCTRARIVTADPITVPARAKTAELARYVEIVQAEMDRVNALAERWAATNRLEPAGATAVRRAA